MNGNCTYCGAELVGREEGQAECPVCGEKPREQAWEQPAAEAAFTLPPSPETGSSGDAPTAVAAGGQEPEAFTLAWEGEGPLLKNLWRTTWQVLLHPVKSFRGPARPGQAWALAYALIMGTLGSALQALWSQVLDKPEWVALPAMWGLILAPLIVLASVYVSAAFTHLGLLMVGGAKRGFTATMRVVGYAYAPAIFFLAPFVGMVVGGVWTLVIYIGGLAGAHGVSGWRVVWAYLLLLLILLAIISIIALLAGAGLMLGVLAQMMGKSGGI